ncbi:hypothetical protein OH76DRAFT_890064 [Lentinus brumalis]|uniref:Uncharacterized protein n=1 Tax=Lentinus brumalis TaxID=2498619 RepID=A0A371D0Y8_9APHY|nr:hypothetical protein OH76DRAFT_890064 [Polyporus brumalis]
MTPANVVVMNATVVEDLIMRPDPRSNASGVRVPSLLLHDGERTPVFGGHRDLDQEVICGLTWTSYSIRAGIRPPTRTPLLRRRLGRMLTSAIQAPDLASIVVRIRPPHPLRLYNGVDATVALIGSHLHSLVSTKYIRSA